MNKHNQQTNQEKFYNSIPRVGITIGDPAGIGTEITLKALADESLQQICTPVIIGDADFVSKIAEQINLPQNFQVVKNESELSQIREGIILYDLENIKGEIVSGQESALTGKASAEYIERAVDLCSKNLIDAITTAPISKKALALGGYDFPGHTEMLGFLTDTKDFRMSFFAGEMCVVLLSTHVSLVDAIKLVRKDKIADLIKFTARQLEKLLGRKPQIAVAGLNPHASEQGMFGTEEQEEIIPAIEECRAEGIEVSGAYSPDTIFLRAYEGEFDAVVSCYHDQATIAVKCLSFGESVNVTLGLPIIRTSVDHGTAFDIAGKNIAKSSSMSAAIKLAAKLAERSKDKNIKQINF